MLRWPARFVDNNLKKRKKGKRERKRKIHIQNFFLPNVVTQNGGCLIAIIIEKSYYPPRKENYGFVIRE